MDSGFLGPDENHAQALEDDYDITRELAPEEVVGIMDGLLCHEVSEDIPEDGLQDDLEHELIIDISAVDGMAYGPPTLPDPVHVFIPRQVIVARAEYT